jgi:hypothetical protein
MLVRPISNEWNTSSEVLACRSLEKSSQRAEWLLKQEVTWGIPTAPFLKGYQLI